MKNKFINSGYAALVMMLSLIASCKKQASSSPVSHGTFSFVKAAINDSLVKTAVTYNVDTVAAVLRISFSAPINTASVAGNLAFTSVAGVLPINYSFDNSDSTLVVRPVAPLLALTSYTMTVLTTVKSVSDSSLKTPVRLTFITQIDSTNKFPTLSDSALLTLVEQQTFNYFWNFGHPVSGLARERTSSGDIVTTGGSGFGIMAMLVGVQRNFITRAQALTRLQTIVDFLSNKVSRYHGAFPHWINGSTGATMPFSTQDDGGDLVETSYMMQGLLCARQFFNSAAIAR